MSEPTPAPSLRDPSIEPDTKDWTWVLETPCPDCGFDSAAVRREEVPNRLGSNASTWVRVLERDDAAVRPASNIWSPVEYACHVRDVHRVFRERLRLMLAVDDPLFENWDQDAAAVQDGYAEQAGSTVAAELAEASDAVAASYAGVEGDQWQRTGRRSDGSVFTIDTLARYHLHDVEHHVHDVSG
jgi:hypothetical protein